ncbi:N-6 DNA methylase [uncultured Bacteroides sp.]|uniref:N-6 DNA methylase n=1 Tax=uncultured Bacteroides sp. TaxID=162156 RepID=UPI002AA6FA3A|nr:N-6 DNA methylase [uncultured Bacteroides sp.]
MKQDELKKFSIYLEELSVKHSRQTIFDDFLTLVVCCLSLGKKEDIYLSTIKKYSKGEAVIFVKAFSALVMEMDNKGQGMKDIFGAYFEEFLSNDKNGQFFTPECICDFMAQITMAGSETGEEKDKRICDPTCGSGRLLLSSAKIDRNKYFVGADISLTCCYMTLINMCLNSMRGEVLYMDSLQNKLWRKWFVIVDSISKVPFIYEVDLTKKEDTEREVEIDEPLEIKEIPTPIIPNIGYVKFGYNC